MIEELEYKVNDRILSLEEQKRFTSFYTLFLIKYRSKLIFRGEKFSALKHKLNTAGEQSLRKFNERIFLIGEKAKIYFKEEIRKKANDINVFGISSVEDDLFVYIFNKLNKIFKKSNSHSEIEKFKDGNKSFCSYFLNTKNRKDFLAQIIGAKTNDDKLNIRDYYISILHRIGKIGIQDKSFFLSTTSDFRIAQNFSKNYNKPDSIILVGWTNSRKLNQWTTHGSRLGQREQLLINYDLPIVNSIIYKHQKEVSMKGGILPHYLIGYILSDRCEFHINPAFFNSNESFQTMINEGFVIDQENFKEELTKTNYYGFFTLFEDGQIVDEYPAHNT